MSRAGRKRIAAQKRSRIRIITAEPDHTRSPNQVARSQPHRMRLYEDICHDARAMTSFGQLNIIGAVSDEDYATGVRFAGVVRRWREIMDCPSPPRSIAGIGLAGAPTRAEIDDAAQRRVDYDNAMGRLATASRTARAITLWVVVEGGRVPAKGFRPLMAGLRALANPSPAPRQSLPVVPVADVAG